MNEPSGALDEITRNRLDDDPPILTREWRLAVILVRNSIYESVFLGSRVVVVAAAPGKISAEYEINKRQALGEAFRRGDHFAANCRALFSLLKEAFAASRVSEAQGA